MHVSDRSGPGQPEPAPSRLAYVGIDRQVHVVDTDGDGRRQVTFPKIPSALTTWGATSGQDSCSWPCWSPNGEWLAVFQSPSGESMRGPTQVFAVQVDGVEERLLAELDEQVPIYAQWNRSGSALAILAQEDDELQLQVCRLAEVGRCRLVDQGVPLFFSWAPDDHSVLLHVGASSGAGRLVVRDTLGRGEDVLYPVIPGSFCAPLFLGEHAVYVAGLGEDSAVCISKPDGSARRELARLEGLLAVVPSPASDRVAVAAAPGGEGTPYRGIQVAEVSGGPLRRVLDRDCMAFFWAPDGQRLVFAAWEARTASMWWSVVDVNTGQRRRLTRYWPTRDQLFFQHFFEQYAPSHSPISSDGRWLVYASYLEPGSSAGPPEGRIMLVDLLDEEPVPFEIAPGTFAVFAPAGARPQPSAPGAPHAPV